MRSALVDRAIVICISAALALWTCCLVILLHVAFDASGESTLVAISATLMGFSFAVVLPGRLVRAVWRVGRWVGLGGALAAVPGAVGPTQSRTREARAMMRLLAAASVLATVGGVVSMGAVHLCRTITDALTDALLFSRAGWTLCKLILQFAAMLPMAGGAAVVFLVLGMIRTGSGRDIYASVFREWMWGVAIGLGAFGVCWEIGLDVRALAATTAVVLVAAAAVILQRRRVTTRPVWLQWPVESPTVGRRAGIALTFGILALAIVLQLRLAGDAVGIGTGAGGCWAAVSLGLLAHFLRIADRRSRPPGKRPRVGATVGLFAGLLLQGSLLVSATGGGAVRVVCVAFAVALQVPIAAMGGGILSRQRRMFAYAGGRARSYVSSASGGAGVAIVVYVIVASVPSGPLIVLAAAFGLCAIAVVAGIALTRRTADQLKWAATGVTLLLALTAAMLGAIRGARGRFGMLRAGVWLTTVSGARTSSRPQRSQGVLPHPPTWRGEGIDAVLRDILSERRGRWIAAVTSRSDLPPNVGRGVHVMVCSPDPSAVPSGAWDDPFVVGSDAGFFRADRHTRRRFDGALLAVIPADHPQGWRCYGERTVRRFLHRLNPDGVGVLRLQSRDGGMGLALAAARAFHDAVGTCWVAFEHRDGQVDLLLAGPVSRIRRPRNRGGLIVFRGRRLWYEWSGVAPLRVVRPRASRAGGPSVGDFVRRLESLPH